MSNQTFEEKLGQEILAYGVRCATQNGNGSPTPAEDYRNAVQAILSLIEEDVIRLDEYLAPSLLDRGDDGQSKYWQNKLRAEQRKIIKGE